jgi:ATP-dependent RNA helicase SUPV3L1/SUV3
MSIVNDHKFTIVLGPTNTGKTRLAIERMMAHGSGMIGLPLRLLAREVYDRVVETKGSAAAALITGEERIAPASARYFVCTVEAMPTGRTVDFVAVDEVQLCTDPDRGHIFTDRVLNARGRHETMLLGSETVRGLLRALVPDASHETRERLSALTYAGSSKVTKLPKRSAVVAFSAEEVYQIAELLRRQRGGAAVVMGALSPATRNAQVAMYQAGEVDFIVATDAIGMGLNMDIDHVAFASLGKWDGHRRRDLRPDELAQIAGRAGRHIRDGTFGVTGDAREMREDVVARIEEHRFEPATRAQWRSSSLDFSSLDALSRSLNIKATHPQVVRKRDALDQLSLDAVMADTELSARARGRTVMVERLWSACQLPDFRKTTVDQHFRLVLSLAEALTSDLGFLKEAWLAAQVRGLDDTTGDVDVLANRLAHMRTWAYVAQRSDWLDDARHWREETAGVEARLSEALHERLTQRFVDKRTSTLLRALHARETYFGAVKPDGTVLIDGEEVGKLYGLRFVAHDKGRDMQARTARRIAEKTVRPEIDQRLALLSKIDEDAIAITDEGAVKWMDAPIAKLTAGSSRLKPEVRLIGGDLGQSTLYRQAETHVQSLVHAHIARLLDVLIFWEAASQNVETGPSGPARGLLFHLLGHEGAGERSAVKDILALVTKDDRRALRTLNVHFGEYTIFSPKMLKPAAARLNAILRCVARGVPALLPPTDGQIVIPVVPRTPQHAYRAMGFRACGPVAVRFDLLERLANTLRDARSTHNQFALTTALRALLGVDEDVLKAILMSLGYRRARQALAPAEGAEGPVMPELWRRLRSHELERIAERKKERRAQAPAPDAKGLSGQRRRKNEPAKADSSSDSQERREARKSNSAKGPPHGKNREHRRPHTPQEAPRRREEKPIDPDSPFAVLAAWQSQRIEDSKKR